MSEGIVYQNKDVLFKVLGETYKDKSLSIYGLDLPPIKELLPTSLPAIQANERQPDHVCLLSDEKTIAMIDYESQSKADALFAYGNRGFRILDAYDRQGKDYNMVIIVIYTGDIKSAPSVLDRGSIRVQALQVFLSEFDGPGIYDELRRKVDGKEPLTDEDMMRFVILPLMNKAGDQERIEAAINLAKQVEDERQQVFIIAGILTAADKFIDKAYSSQVKEWLKMTQVARLYEEEKIEAVNLALLQAEKKQKEEKLQIARNFIESGVDILTVMKSTGLMRDDIESAMAAGSETPGAAPA